MTLIIKVIIDFHDDDSVSANECDSDNEFDL